MPSRTDCAVRSFLIAVCLGAFFAAHSQPVNGDVVWNSPSKDASGSMPLGNGNVGINVWVEQDGDLLMYLSRTDAISEASRFLKLGRVRMHFDPNPFAAGRPFTQRLNLHDGCIQIHADDLDLKLLVASDQDVVRIAGTSATPRTVKASVEIWRTAKHSLAGEELQSSWTMLNAPADIPVIESPDVVLDLNDASVAWYHHNESSAVPFSLKHQGIEALSPLAQDPIINRTFGGLMLGTPFKRSSTTSVATSDRVLNFDLSIVTASIQAPPIEWKQNVQRMAAGLPAFSEAAVRTANWWHDFWNRSWIVVSGDADADRITQAYALQRFVAACSGRGSFPIKFNGSIFTVEPKFAGGPDFDADWRRWGDCYWWQNTRLPYAPLAMTGDEDILRSLFDFYLRLTPLCKARAKLYYGAKGVYYPETMTPFGTYANGDYGWSREGKPASQIDSPWWQYAWQQGLELLTLMLDSYEIEKDEPLLTNDILPLAQDVLGYYDTRFKRDEFGKMIISPTQAVETYWTNVVNDTPSVAGLISVLDRLLSIKSGAINRVQRAYFQELRKSVPALPTATIDGKIRILPAQKYDPKRTNVENPELYAIWPYRLITMHDKNADVGVNTFLARQEHAEAGWSYDGQCAALLGLGDEAKRQLISKSKNSNPRYRFPATWGPNYDWLPDQTHGGNLMLTLQYMLMQFQGGEIYLLPAWPKGWDVAFKLHGPDHTTVICEAKSGRIVRLEVSPAKRRGAVHPPPR